MRNNFSPTPDLISTPDFTTVAFKKKASRKVLIPIVKDICAFANTAGGTLLIGVDQDGKISGLTADQVYLERYIYNIGNKSNQLLRTSVDELLDFKIEVIEQATILRIDVQKSLDSIIYQNKSCPLAKKLLILRTSDGNEESNAIPGMLPLNGHGFSN